MRTEPSSTPAFRDGQEGEELILSRSHQEVGGNQERASWKPTGGFHIINFTATCKVGSIISLMRLQESAAGQWWSWDLNQGLSNCKIQEAISAISCLAAQNLAPSRGSISAGWVDGWMGIVSSKKW